MPAVRRWLFNLAAAVSLVVCVATLALWVRSYWVADQVFARTEGVPDGRAARSFWRVSSASGRLLIYHVAGASSDPAWVNQKGVNERGRRAEPIGAKTEATARFRFERYSRDAMAYQSTPAGRLTFMGSSWVLGFPHWLPVVLSLGLCVLWIASFRRRRARGMVGLCPSCGYDLRATPDQCPECGRAVGVTNKL
jgi:hypothetical protein